MRSISSLISARVLLVVLFARLFVPSNAFATFHLWDINEIYSNADGTFQFIELTTTFNSQQFIGGHNIDATSDGNVITFTFPSNSGSPTANKKLLLATSDIAATLGFPTPDFIIPSNFFDPNADAIRIDFVGADFIVFTSSDLPTDGILSIDSNLGAQPASPTNFAGNSVSPPFEIDTDGDGDPDVTDPDDDNDGIGDAFDTDPLVANNECTGGDGDNATLGVSVVADLTCAARVSIDVQGTTQVLGPPAHLHIIAPFIGFQSGFSSGWLTVISADPCPGCSP